MYEADLKQERLALESIYLDPNNPRFPEKRNTITGKRIIETNVQAKAEERIANFGVKDLANSIIRNGFLPLDRIVVREIKEHNSKYVVVEGNRRLAALRMVQQSIDDDEVEADDLSEEYLENLRESIREINCLVYTGSETDIAWILQGIRHLSGIRDWAPAEKAELIAKEINERGTKFRAIGESLGMTAQKVGKYYRAHCALEQLKNDPDYGDRYEGALFTLFDEALSKRRVKSWLNWDEQDKAFKDVDNLHRFYSWITKDPDYNDDRLIHDPRQMKILDKIVDSPDPSIIQQLDDRDITLEQAEAQAQGTAQDADWRTRLQEAETSIRRTPVYLLTEDPEGLAEILQRIRKQVDDLLKHTGQE
ncbi:hypothetical protein [Nocardiopsis flavescens]